MKKRQGWELLALPLLCAALSVNCQAEEAAESDLPAVTETAQISAPAGESQIWGSKGEIERTEVTLTDEMPYADCSKIHSGAAILYSQQGASAKGITVCVNAGHGTRGGESVQTLSHPDGTPKVTGGTNAEGAVTSMAVSTGMTFLDGTPEAVVTLQEALLLRDLLLEQGYSVLMIREEEDVQLDNVARTVLANSYADCHIALHWDGSDSDKGVFYCSVPNVQSYRAMEPVASTWEKSEILGKSLVTALSEAGFAVFEDGTLEVDLTQTSYSSIPSVDIELGDAASDHSEEQLAKIAQGLAKGVDAFFGLSGEEN